MEKIIHNLLNQFGITANYRGFFYISYAVLLALREPERLTYVTKMLYPEVAKYYGTTWSSVERGIRTVVAHAWTVNPACFEVLAGRPVNQKPTAACFIAFFVMRIRNEASDLQGEEA